MTLELLDFVGIFVVVALANAVATLGTQYAITRYMMPDLGGGAEVQEAPEGGFSPPDAGGADFDVEQEG